jgi:hypothetical protein
LGLSNSTFKHTSRWDIQLQTSEVSQSKLHSAVT